MINKNYRNGAEDIAKIAAKGFDMVGKEIVGLADWLEKYRESQKKIKEEMLDFFDDDDARLKLQEYGFTTVDFSLIDDMSPENKVVFVSALSLLVDADETRNTSEYFGVAVVRFRVQQIIDNENARIEKLVARLSADEAALLVRMICEMVAISNNNSAVLSVSEAIIDCLTISNKDKQRIKSEVDKFADSCGGAFVFISLLVSECPPITDETENSALDNDGYDICESFSNFSGGQKKFSGIDIVFTNRYDVSDTSLKFENCNLVFDSSFPQIVKIAGGKLMFVNCKFASKQKPDDIAFILKDTDVELYGCTFDKWDAGLFLSMDSGNLSLMECSLLSCGCKLISAKQLTDVAIDKCHVKNHKGGIADLHSSKSGPIEIKNCVFFECYYSSSSLFEVYHGSGVIMNHATIVNCGMNIISGSRIEFQQCVFEGCHDDMDITSFLMEIKFSYCDITNHKGNIGTAFWTSSHIIIESCKLKNVKGSIFAERLDVNNTTFENCSGDPSGFGINTENHLNIKDSFGLNPSHTMSPTGSLFEIKPKKESVVSQISKCKFVGCRSNGALIAAFSKDRDKSVVNINNCEIIDCRCAEGYFVGVHVKKFVGIHAKYDEYFLAPKTKRAYQNRIDLFDDEHKEKLLAFLKNTLNDGLIQVSAKFHKERIKPKVEKNIREKVMSGIHDDILTMYDTSLFEDGKSGLVFGSQAIYLTQMLEPNYMIPYEKIALIKDLSIERKKYDDNYKAKLIIGLGNNRSIIFNDPNFEKNELKKLLLGIKEVFYTGE